MQLQQIEHGNYSAERFMTDIMAFVKMLCEKYNSEDTSVSFGTQYETIGKCPKCDGDVKDGKFGFHCTAKCGMIIGKVYGKTLTETQVKKLLSGKEISYTVSGKKTTVLPEVIQNDYQGKTYYQWKTGNNSNSSESLGKCPKCGGEIKTGNYGIYCTAKCGMNIGKVYGKSLTETQVKMLLSGKTVSYTANGKTTTILPEFVQNDYQGKTYYQWKTEK